MRIQITLYSSQKISLPLDSYMQSLQGLIYNNLEPNLANWLHGEAYAYAKRTFKMLTFSRLKGEYKLDLKNKRITFSSSVSFKLASYNTDVLSSFAEHLLKRPSLRLGSHECQVSGVEVLKKPELDYSKPIRVKALSPITVYSTLAHADGRKKTYYYNPQEQEWGEMILQNLVRKVGALEWEEDPNKALEGAYMRLVKANNKDRKIIKYKNFVILAWMGVYEMKLPQPYFELAYDVGVGAKNAQGFGMVEVVSPLMQRASCA